jgi:ATP-dependent DNA helicase RecQ
VFHHDPAESVEAYAQEAGRAGRDGLPARCVLLATSQDGGQLKSRARGDLPSLALVREAWALVERSVGEDGYSLLDPAQLVALDPEDDVKPRVALSILAEAGAVQRLADAPRTLRVHGGGWPSQEVSLFDAARRLALPPEKVEPRLLALEADGALFFQVGPRAILHRVLSDPSEAPKVLDRYAALAEQRGAEILDYVKTKRCRQGYVRGYFGEQAPAECGNCDNCLGLAHELPEETAQDEADARRHVLNALSGARGIGERNLIWHLRGDARSPPWADKLPARGALGLRSESRVKALVQSLSEMGHVERVTLDHGGQMLKLTPKGLDALFGDRPILAPKPQPQPQPKPHPGPQPESVAQDDPLFQALKAWRRERADADAVPPYVVASDATLRAIAAAKPKNAGELLAIKGIGPKKVESYGEAILAIVTSS